MEFFVNINETNSEIKKKLKIGLKARKSMRE